MKFSELKIGQRFRVNAPHREDTNRAIFEKIDKSKNDDWPAKWVTVNPGRTCFFSDSSEVIPIEDEMRCPICGASIYKSSTWYDNGLPSLTRFSYNCGLEIWLNNKIEKVYHNRNAVKNAWIDVE